MLKRLTRGGAAAGLLAVLVACAQQAGSVPVTQDALLAASSPGWRIVKVLPIAAMGGLSVPGARDAWLAGDSCADAQCDRDTVIVRHWDGTAWRAVPSPRAVTDDAGVGAVAASSASNAWVFSTRGSDVTDTTALHWTANGWAPPVRLAADIDAAVALSAGDAWAFGAPASDPQAGYIAHFDGKNWSHASFPVQVSDASALSASDIWVGGVEGAATDESAVIEHWNGKAWRETPLPSLGIATGSWISTSVTAVWFCHDAVGHWTKTAVPRHAGEHPGIDSMAWIPGTRSLWATGGFDADAGEAILKYGT